MNSNLTDYKRNLEVNDKNRIFTKEHIIIFDYVFFVILCGLVGCFGIVTNVINIIVFYKQGFVNTVNIAFLGLAISDLCCLVSISWASICMNPAVEDAGVPWLGVEVMYFSAGWPHLTFCRITSFITVYITGERCLSIAFPLKIKQIVTKTRTATIISLIFFINFMTVVPEWTCSYIGWRFVEERNRTLLGAIFKVDRDAISGNCFIFQSLISTASFFGVVIFTVILVIKIIQNSKVRSDLTAVDDQKGGMSVKDKRAIKLTIFIACTLIICYLPGAGAAMAVWVIGPEFNIQSTYFYIGRLVFGIAFFFNSINSAVNIFVYYRMSSKYKQTFYNVFSNIMINCKESAK